MKKIIIGVILGIIITLAIETPFYNNQLDTLNAAIESLHNSIATKDLHIADLTAELGYIKLNNDINKYIPDEESVEALAKTLYGECRGVASTTEQACVAWCILNRVDVENKYGDTVLEVVSQPNQFSGYDEDNKITQELKDLAIDVMQRWLYEKDHPDSYCGRVLPKDYCYFIGFDGHNWFTNVWNSSDYFEYTMLSPYVD